MRALTTTWLAVSAIGLSLTLQLSDGFYYEPALAWLGFVLATALLGVARCPWPRLRRGEDEQVRDDRGYGGEPSLPAVLVVGVMASAGALVTRPLGRYMADPWLWDGRSTSTAPSSCR